MTARLLSLPRHTGISRPVASLFGALLRLDRDWRARQRLAQLEDHRLRDIGLTPDERDRHLGRRPWDAPANWRR